MSRIIVVLMTLIISLAFSGGAALAQKDPGIKCSGCHKNLSPLLPGSHKHYRTQNTAACLSCHKKDGKAKPLGESIHTAHLKKKPETMDNCFSCHSANKAGEVVFQGFPGMKATRESMEAAKPFFKSWMQSSHLDNSHRSKGVYCLACHTSYVDDLEVTETKDNCIKCHGGYDKLVQMKTRRPYENNPHKSHYPDLKCDVCHHGHKEFTDYCGQCHKFDYKAPGAK